MKPLKYFVAIFLILGMVIPKNGFHFLLHLPALIHHYQNHVRQHGSVALIDFIDDHVVADGHHENEHPEDNNLPFSHQHSGDCCSTLNFVPLPSTQAFCFHIPVATDNNLANRQFFFSSEFIRTIWQPPRIS